MAVGVTNVGADLSSVVLGLGQEFGTLGGPFPISLGDVRDADVQECADTVWVGRRGKSHRGLVVGRPTSGVEDQPGVRDLQDDGVALKQNLTIKNGLVEVAGPILVGNNQKICDDEANSRRRKVIRVHLPPPSVWADRAPYSAGPQSSSVRPDTQHQGRRSRNPGAN